MIRFLGTLPKRCTVAFSGGVDSVAVADFLINGRKEVQLAFFHHGTATSDAAEPFVRAFAEARNIPLIIGRISTVRDPKKSQEEFWRDERYSFLDSLGETVVTAHHLDDAVETWIFTSLHGTPRAIPYQRGRVIRPFLVTPKSELRGWAERRGLTWEEDPSNGDDRYMRNLIRRQIVPAALRVNPGLPKVVAKKYLNTSAPVV